MKKGKKRETTHVRVSLRTYELLRRIAFKTHTPMPDIIDAWAKSQKV